MQERRRLRPPFFMVKGYDSGRLLPARSGLSLPDPDSCHSCGTVCSTPSCNMDRITRYGDASCFFCPVIFSLRVVPASKQSLAEHVIRHPDVMRQNCRPKTELCLTTQTPASLAEPLRINYAKHGIGLKR